MYDYIIPLPIRVPISIKKKFSLNLNEYRNAHYFTLNTAKQKFEEIVSKLIIDLPIMDTIYIHYVYFPKSKILSDTNNVCSIVDKFFADTLVNQKKLVDDNYTIMPITKFSFGSVDKNNPRVEARIIINPYNRETIMKFTLTHSDVQTAIENYVNSLITLKEGQSLSVSFVSDEGDTLEVNQVVVDLKAGNAKTEPVKKTAQTPNSEPVKEEVAVVKSEATPPATTTPSIFANLKKPVNE